MTIHRNRIVALGVASAIAIGFAVSAGPVQAAPVPSNTVALKQIDVNNVVDVQWRRRGAGPWVAAAALSVVGAVIANEAYRDHYYDSGYGNEPYAYAQQYPAQRYYGGYAPYNGYSPYRTCDNGAVC